MNVWLVEAAGKIHEGVHVHGCMDRRSLEQEIRRATNGLPLLVCVEPLPGRARAYVRTAQEDRDERAVDLRGAIVTRVDMQKAS